MFIYLIEPRSWHPNQNVGVLVEYESTKVRGILDYLLLTSPAVFLGLTSVNRPFPIAVISQDGS